MEMMLSCVTNQTGRTWGPCPNCSCLPPTQLTHPFRVQKPHTLTITTLPILWRSSSPTLSASGSQTWVLMPQKEWQCSLLSQVSTHSDLCRASRPHSTQEVKDGLQRQLCRGKKSEFLDQNLREGGGRACCPLPVLLGGCFSDKSLHFQATTVSSVSLEPSNASLYPTQLGPLKYLALDRGLGLPRNAQTWSVRAPSNIV